MLLKLLIITTIIATSSATVPKRLEVKQYDKPGFLYESIGKVTSISDHYELIFSLNLNRVNVMCFKHIKNLVIGFCEQYEDLTKQRHPDCPEEDKKTSYLLDELEAIKNLKNNLNETNAKNNNFVDKTFSFTTSICEDVNHFKKIYNDYLSTLSLMSFMGDDFKEGEEFLIEQVQKMLKILDNYNYGLKNMKQLVEDANRGIFTEKLTNAKEVKRVMKAEDLENFSLLDTKISTSRQNNLILITLYLPPKHAKQQEYDLIEVHTIPLLRHKKLTWFFLPHNHVAINPDRKLFAFINVTGSCFTNKNEVYCRGIEDSLIAEHDCFTPFDTVETLNCEYEEFNLHKHQFKRLTNDTLLAVAPYYLSVDFYENFLPAVEITIPLGVTVIQALADGYIRILRIDLTLNLNGKQPQMIEERFLFKPLDYDRTEWSDGKKNFYIKRENSSEPFNVLITREKAFFRIGDKKLSKTENDKSSHKKNSRIRISTLD